MTGDRLNVQMCKCSEELLETSGWRKIQKYLNFNVFCRTLRYCNCNFNQTSLLKLAQWKQMTGDVGDICPEGAARKKVMGSLE